MTCSQCVFRQWETRNTEDEEIPELVGEESHNVGREITGRIRLNRLAPLRLATLLSSDLFQEDAIYKAFKFHALLAERKGHSVDHIPEEHPIDSGECCVVKGAGCTEVSNGVYTKSGALSDGVPEYHLKGRTFLNHPVTYKVSRWKTADGVTRWWLTAFSGEDFDPITFLYSANLDVNDPEDIPRRSWQQGEEDVGEVPEPPPLVLEIY